MSQATRCSACGTVFRVVEDQLEASEGWVRCGRCDEVFRAIDALFPLPLSDPPDAAQPPAAAATATAAVVEALPLIEPADSADADLVERIEAEVFGRRAEAPLLVEPPPLAGTEWQPLLRMSADVAEPPHGFDAAGDAAASPIFGDGPAHAPEFIRAADRQAHWRYSGHRIGLALGVLALSIALLWQALNHFRDLSAARWPALRPVLGAWCALTGCTLQAPRRIDDISVEATTLTRAAEPDAFRLAVTLRNRGTMTVLMPSIDLSLTDTAGQLIARRSLAPRDLQATAALPAGGEAALQVLLSAGTPGVAGYTVEIFYP